MFQTIKANLDNPVSVIYLSDKTQNNGNSIVFKLNYDYCKKGSHIDKVYHEYQKGTRDFVTRVKRFMSRKKDENSSGYIFEFIRLFRGHYEFTDIIDKYTIGYMVASKKDVIDYFGRKSMTNGLVLKTHSLMNERLDNLNENYKVSI